MCQSVAQGGTRCDTHLKATVALFDYAQTTVPTRLVSPEEMKTIWSGLKKGHKDATAPTARQYADFLDKEKFRIEYTKSLSDEDKQRLQQKLDAAAEQNLPTGSGFAAQQDFINRVRTLAHQRYKQVAAKRQVVAPAPTPAPEPANSFTKPMVEAWGNDEEYTNWPIPQANDLDKVASVVDSISHEATTADSIGEAIEVGERQGSYYANAAGYLGLVEKHKDDLGSTHYALTQAGQTFANSGPAERAAMLAEMVNRTPLARSYRQNPNLEALQKDIAAGNDNGGYSDTVAKRRTSTLTSWISAIENVDQFTNQISTQQRDTLQRSISASMKQREETAEKRRQLSIQRSVGETCNSCFMVKPVSNICPNCD